VSPGRPRADRCPGALVLHEAADGGLARIRLPGGLVDGETLAALAALAESFGVHGAVELTSRGNLQLRGVPLDRRAELAERVADLGLLPSATHERVRNIVASPYAGLGDAAARSDAVARSDAAPSDATAPFDAPGSTRAASRPLDGRVRALDEALCADPDLAGLSGRFLFGLDDGSGDIRALGPDAWAEPAAAGRWWVGPAGVEVAGDEVVGELLAAARAFLRAAEAAGSFWRVRDLPDAGAALAAGLRAGRPARPRPAGSPPARHAADRIGGWRRPDGGHAGAVHVPLGRLTRPAAELLAAGSRPPAGRADPGGQPLRITPWRSIVVPFLTDPSLLAARAAEVGLVTDPASTWTRVTACAGRPGCASALADVRSDAARAVAAGAVLPTGDAGAADLVPVAPDRHVAGASAGGAGRGEPSGDHPAGVAPAGGPRAAGGRPARAHWSGCARRCGRPAGPHVEVVAGPDGYVVRDACAEPKEARW